MLNVLILAPDGAGDFAQRTRPALIQAGYRVAEASLDVSGGTNSLCAAFAGRPPDVLVADLSATCDCLPLRHVARLLRNAWSEDLPTPPRLALLTPHHLAHTDWPAHVDDFMLPPYEAGEILARLTQLTFRKRHIQGADTLVVADVTLDLAGSRAMTNSGLIVPLTPREFELLRFLALHRGKFFARDRLLDMVWGVEFDGGERTVDIHMRRLRAKLPPEAAALLETRRGIGYSLAVTD